MEGTRLFFKGPDDRHHSRLPNLGKPKLNAVVGSYGYVQVPLLYMKCTLLQYSTFSQNATLGQR